MRQVATALIALACLAISAWGSVQAQPAGTVSVGFRNQTNLTVIVQGYTIVNGSVRKGATITIKKNAMAFENHVPTGARYYTIHDANQPSRILLGDHRVQLGSRDTFYTIATSTTNPNQVMLVPSNP